MSDNTNSSGPVNSSPAQVASSVQADSGAKNNEAPKQVGNDLFEVKVNGKVIKMSRDEVIQHASMSHAAQSKFEEAAKSRKQVEKILATAKSNPIQALMDPALGLTKEQIRDAFEQWYSKEYIEPETLSPEQRKYKEMQEKLSKYEQEEKEKREKEERESEEKLTSQAREHLQEQIKEAIETSGLPKTRFLAERMAFYMLKNLQNGWDAPIQVIVNQVKQEQKAMLANLTESSDVETLINTFGEGVINKIRRYDLEKLRSSRQNQAPSFKQSNSNNEPTDRISASQARRRLRSF